VTAIEGLRGPAIGRSCSLVFALLLILAATLIPASTEAASVSFLCVLCGERAAADAVLNTVLFAPFGLAVALYSPSWVRVALLSAVLSCSIELAQVVIPGRYPSLGDVIFNTAGGVLGAACTHYLHHTIFQANGKFRGTWLGSLMFACGILMATGYALTPSLPRSLYYGQWTPNLGHLDLYQGQVLQASLSDFPIHQGALPRSDTIRSMLLAGENLQVDALAGPQTAALAPILSIYDAQQREIMVLGADRADAVFRLRTLGLGLGFDQPDLRAAGDLSAVGVGDRLRIVVQSAGRGYCISVNGTRHCGLGFTLGRGWALLFYPERWSSGWRRAMDIAWIALIFSLVGLFGCNRWSLPIDAAALAIVWLGTLWINRNLSPSGWELASALAGLLTGDAVSRMRFVLLRPRSRSM
jgi:glycopeptide antibiotics resistance protein